MKRHSEKERFDKTIRYADIEIFVRVDDYHYLAALLSASFDRSVTLKLINSNECRLIPYPDLH